MRTKKPANAGFLLLVAFRVLKPVILLGYQRF